MTAKTTPKGTIGARKDSVNFTTNAGVWLHQVICDPLISRQKISVMFKTSVLPAMRATSIKSLVMHECGCWM